jgi:menaquinol-cytochrome c reductase iron-sulfur subunit
MTTSGDHLLQTIQDAHRRSFLERFSILLSGLIGMAVALPGLGFILAPIFRRPAPKWRSVGRIGTFEIGATVLVHFEDASPLPWAGVTGTTGAWLRREAETEFVAFSIKCRHLGCPERWVTGAGLFMCPSHGGVYYRDGTVAGGPPPKPLKRYSVRVRDGDVEIETGPVPLTTTPLDV